MPRARTADDAERCYRVLRDYVDHIKKHSGVRFVTARELPETYAGAQAPHVARDTVRKHVVENGVTFLETPEGTLSAGEALEILLGLEPRFVEGPAERGQTTWHGGPIPRVVFDRAKTDTADYIRTRGVIPPVVWLGVECLSPRTSPPLSRAMMARPPKWPSGKAPRRSSSTSQKMRRRRSGGPFTRRTSRRKR